MSAGVATGDVVATLVAVVTEEHGGFLVRDNLWSSVAAGNGGICARGRRRHGLERCQHS